MKDARSEAQKEIDEYKKQKEAEFKKFESEVCAPCSVPCLKFETNYLAIAYWSKREGRGRIQQGSRAKAERNHCVQRPKGTPGR